MRRTLLALALGLSLAAHAQTPATKIESRFETFAGSSANSHSLVTGLRTGGEITLIDAGETVTFTSPARPMGYGNITRSLDLAQRQLAAQGIQDPTPTELHTALMGGSIDGTDYRGILQMRADGMGWGQIAHAAGVHPGLGKGAATLPAPSRPSGIVNAASGSPFSHANANGRALGRSSTRPSAAHAAGPAAGANAGGHGAVRAAAGGGNGHGNAFGRSK